MKTRPIKTLFFTNTPKFSTFFYKSGLKNCPAEKELFGASYANKYLDTFFGCANDKRNSIALNLPFTYIYTGKNLEDFERMLISTIEHECIHMALYRFGSKHREKPIKEDHEHIITKITNDWNLKLELLNKYKWCKP